jgi:beta-N-acetylhexosaminidase
MKRKNKQKKGISKREKIFIALIVLVFLLASLNVAKAKGWLLPEQNDVNVENNIIELNSLTLEQKIAQMVIVHGGMHNLEVWQRLQLGGIHLFAMQDAELYKKVISDFQTGMSIPFFVTVDLEGCLNPFSEFYDSAPVSEISSVEESFNKGRVDGNFLQSIGVTINFAPVVDLDDQIWGCRSFPGTEEEIAELAEAYILGLQRERVIATVKHYPGKTLVIKDPHKQLVSAVINPKDLYPYQYLSDRNHQNAYMTSHLIVTGELDSNGNPSVVSDEIINSLKDKKSLMISDDTMMLGLRNFYSTPEQLYIDVFKAGNDLILNFDEDPLEINHMIKVVAEAVESGEISLEQIDNSVRKILQAKGFIVE